MAPNANVTLHSVCVRVLLVRPVFGSSLDCLCIPVACVLFSTREELSAHADYDPVVLTELLRRFKAGTGRNDAGEEFEIRVGITDHDVREQNTLSTVWPKIHRLLCMFDVCRAWQNRLNRCVAHVRDGPYRKDPRKRLASFMMQLWVLFACFALLLVRF